MVTKRAVVVLSVLLCCGELGAQQVTRKERVIGGPCEGCDWVFDAIPATIGPVARIAPAGEPGEPMRIEGVVRNAAGQPAAGIVVYAYHTNIKGEYPTEGQSGKAPNRHGALRGWAQTDSSGRYRFHTIRPAGYPSSSAPQHVHFHIIEPGKYTYWIDEMVFTDDPRLTPTIRKSVVTGRSNGVVTPKRDATGTWLVTMDITLGQGIPGYR